MGPNTCGLTALLPYAMLDTLNFLTEMAPKIPKFPFGPQVMPFLIALFPQKISTPSLPLPHAKLSSFRHHIYELPLQILCNFSLSLSKFSLPTYICLYGFGVIWMLSSGDIANTY
ncbi:hypothetical protein Pfo_001987, partial [Paulownia fortunei]